MTVHTLVGLRAFSHLKKSAVFIMEMRTDCIKALISEVSGGNEPYQNSRAILSNMKPPVSCASLGVLHLYRDSTEVEDWNSD